MIPIASFSVADAICRLETDVGFYLLVEQESGLHSRRATASALERVKGAFAHVQWCRDLAKELTGETGRPPLFVIPGGLLESVPDDRDDCPTLIAGRDD